MHRQHGRYAGLPLLAAATCSLSGCSAAHVLSRRRPWRREMLVWSAVGTGAETQVVTAAMRRETPAAGGWQGVQQTDASSPGGCLRHPPRCGPAERTAVVIVLRRCTNPVDTTDAVNVVLRCAAATAFTAVP